MVALESMVLFKRNKTAAWLKTKSCEEKEKLLKSCIKVGREHRRVDKERQRSIQAHRQEMIKKRELKIISKRKKEQEKKEQLCHKISELGFWSTEKNVDAGLCEQSEATRKKFLETQLRFRQHVLKQSTADKSLYQLSRHKRKLSSSELRANLEKLISAYPRLSSLEEMLHSPQLLVGSKIQHRFEDEDGELGWYRGLVIGYSNAEHEVIYFGEETIYQFNLFEDFSSGDLKLDIP